MSRPQATLTKIKEETDSIRVMLQGGTGIVGLWNSYQERIDSAGDHLDNIDRLLAELTNTN